MKNRFHLEVFLTALCVAGGLWLLSLIALKIDFLNPFVQSLRDFEMTDVIFSKLHPTDLADTNIVIVNIGNLPRPDIARQIERIYAQNPKVIGLDAFFMKEKKPELDSLLVTAISRSRDKIIMASRLHYNDSTETFDSCLRSHPKFLAATGFANVVTEEAQGHKTIRSFSPKEIIHSVVENSFAVAIAKKYDSISTEGFIRRNNSLEDINFRGNYQHFYTFDASECLDTSINLSVMKGKIVLLGYMGESLSQLSLEDVFFTPLNPRPAGRALPDMYGIVVHANIISMILKSEYINSFPDWLELVLNILLAYISIWGFSYLYIHRQNWFDSITVALQLLIPLTILFIQFYSFDQFRFKFSMTLAICAIAITADGIEIYHEILKNWIFRTKKHKEESNDEQ
ncbi:MAG: CHASE2 domain-containing protein [Bacteroidetes bacterium]|nr:CHASE2 domain-containing protein [Bacteroidota bacterium]